MAGFTKFVSMELEDDEALDMPMPIATSLPSFPPGLRMCFCEPEIQKLEAAGLDCNEVEVGDVIDMRIFGRVTCVSDVQTSDGRCRRLEIQGEEIAVENEADEEPGEE